MAGARETSHFFRLAASIKSVQVEGHAVPRRDDVETGLLSKTICDFPGFDLDHGYAEMGQNGRFGPDLLDDAPGVGNAEMTVWTWFEADHADDEHIALVVPAQFRKVPCIRNIRYGVPRAVEVDPVSLGIAMVMFHRC